jgi:BirA family transcriptional regulator, biotin operon repressor / biotin---[acetyl-CoA-carboxylase] ligase
LQILSLKTVPSTQEYLKELLKKKEVTAPYAVTSDIQTRGIGSRNNEWKGLEGNIFVSFVLKVDSLPVDLKMESASIYFSYILKETLEEFGSKVWLKWPNDFYIDRLKIGGMITNLVGENIICGFGLNLNNAPEGFGRLDVKLDKFSLLNTYFINLEKKVLWKQVFSKYKLEFDRNRNFFTHMKNKKINLSEARLENDGSLNINGERMYSLR